MSVTLLLLAAGVLLDPLGGPPVRRTQEARVLETAREMLGTGLDGWMIPHLNGVVRLQKPPLAYWLSAGSFKIWGVSEWSGRVPAALSGGLTVVVTFLAGRWLFSWRTAWLSATALLGSYLFAKHSQLAETDGLAGLFVTAAIYAMWRGAGRRPGSGTAGGRRHARWWYCGGAAATGLAFLSKGGPGLFPLLFLAALAWDRRRPGVLRDWFVSGAPVVLAAVAVPWYAYVIHARGFETLRKEISVVVSGEDHGGWFFMYLPALLVAVMPWPALSVWGIGLAVRRWRRDARVRGLLLWAMAVLLPLCFAGNKQSHYLVPVMPPVMLLTARMADLALRRRAAPGSCRQLRLCLLATAAGIAISGAGLPLVSWLMVRQVRGIDLGAAATLIAGALVAGVSLRRRGTAMGLYLLTGSSAVILPLLAGLWMPSLYVTDSRRVASQLKERFGAGPYCFLADGPYLPLCFALRSTIPNFKTVADLEESPVPPPGLLVLTRVGQRREPGGATRMPDGFAPLGTVGARDEQFEVYRFDADPPAPRRMK